MQKYVVHGMISVFSSALTKGQRRQWCNICRTSFEIYLLQSVHLLFLFRSQRWWFCRPGVFNLFCAGFVRQKKMRNKVPSFVHKRWHFCLTNPAQTLHKVNLKDTNSVLIFRYQCFLFKENRTCFCFKFWRQKFFKSCITCKILMCKCKLRLGT
jgi:hypothetical protein